MAHREFNLILMSDSYKYSHYLQYPPKTEFITSYIEAREGGWDSEILFNGLDLPIKEYLVHPVTHKDIYKAKAILAAHGLPLNESGWLSIVENHGGFLPIVIEALPEGTIARPGVPLVQVTNTDENLPWVTSFVETLLLRAIWYPTTVGSQSREVKKIIKHYLEETADNLDGLPFKLHDFGARGATSHESARIGGTAHLINFMGTDTIEAVETIYDNYNGFIAGFSIPASEHSTITSWGRDGESAAYENMLDQFGTGLVACVSDSYDLYSAITNIWGNQLKQKILSMGGTLVVRPDSGDPVEVTLKVIELLGSEEAFGYTVNSKGFKMLPPCIRIIQGDGVNIHSIGEILQNYMDHGWSADNIAFGMGGALLQKGIDRDTMRFAMKANEAIVDGTARDVYKDPATDHSKRSKTGKQAVVRTVHNTLQAVRYEDLAATDAVDNTKSNLMIKRFENGLEYNPSTFEEIRERAKL